MQQSNGSYIDKFHNLIDDDYEARACKDIDDDACKVVAGNYLLVTMSLVLSKVADTLVSAKVVLPWLMTATGAPLFLTALLVPIRESGSMLPQLFLGAYIRLKPIRKYFLILGSVLQAFVVLGFALVPILFEGLHAGIVIVVLTVLFSLSRAISSIANKDVTGKTVPKNERGRLTGTAASIAGLVCIGFGLMLMYSLVEQASITYLLVVAAAFFGLSSLSYGLIKEYAGATDGGINAVKVAKDNLRLLYEDREFTRFVLVRGFMISSGLSAPYFVLMAQSQQGSNLQILGLLIVISGIASFISGRIWGRIADKNSKKLIIVTAALNTVICVTGALISFTSLINISLSLFLFFLISVIHEGVRQARKTYLTDMVSGNKRTDYVSLSNTLIGVLLLLVGLVSGVIAHTSLTAMLLFFAVFSLVALVLSLSMKNVSS